MRTLLIPPAVANLKLSPIALWLFGREIIETDDLVGSFTVSN